MLFCFTCISQLATNTSHLLHPALHKESQCLESACASAAGVGMWALLLPLQDIYTRRAAVANRARAWAARPAIVVYFVVAGQVQKCCRQLQTIHFCPRHRRLEMLRCWQRLQSAMQGHVLARDHTLTERGTLSANQRHLLYRWQTLGLSRSMLAAAAQALRRCRCMWRSCLADTQSNSRGDICQECLLDIPNRSSNEGAPGRVSVLVFVEPLAVEVDIGIADFGGKPLQSQSMMVHTDIDTNSELVQRMSYKWPLGTPAGGAANT